MITDPFVVDHPDALDEALCLRVAGGLRLELGPGVLEGLVASRRALLDRLDGGDPVYGVTTGMGAASTILLDPAAQSVHQENLMLARSVGSAPWLTVQETRMAMVVRLRTLLHPEAGVSAELCVRLVELLNAGVHPALPATRLGAAGEIIPLAHLGAVLTGAGECLAGFGAGDGGGGAGSGGASAGGARDTSIGAAGADVVPAAAALAAAGLAPFRLGPKEGVALIEGVPVTTGLALLRAQEARLLATQVTVALAAELALLGASRDPFRPEVARSDPELTSILARVGRLAGPEGPAGALQAPLSFRVAGPALAHLARAADAVDAAAHRALVGVTDSPAFLGGRFVGTAGFDGFELAAALDGLRIAVVHVAEVSASRLHRLLDDRVTGLPRQLSDQPGLHAGMVTVHKRAVGVVHELVRVSAPASIGAIETSLGQEDVQSFSVEAAVAVGAALAGARDVLACELLAVVQAGRLGARAGGGAGAGAGRGGGGGTGAGAGASAGAVASVGAGASVRAGASVGACASAGAGASVGAGAGAGGVGGLGAGAGVAASGPRSGALLAQQTSAAAPALASFAAAADAPALAFVAELDAALPPGTADRPFGRDVAAIAERLAAGWASSPPV